MKGTFIKQENGILPHCNDSMAMFDKIPNGNFVKVSYSEGRTLSQNALFHRWCREISKYFYDNGKTHFGCGKDMNETNMKENLKTTYLGFETKTYTDLSTGEIIKKEELIKTSDLDKEPMASFMMLVDAFCVEYGIPISKPGDSEYMQILREMGEAV